MEYTYEIFDDGYDILKNGGVILKQRDPYGKIFIPNGSYEENAIAHCAELNKPPIPPAPTSEEKLRADIDYIAIMEDLELPSYTDEEGE